MKTCIKCGSERSGQSYCKPCANEIGRQNYQLNRERYIAQAKKRDEQLDRLILKHKNQPCTDCDIQYPPYVMDFDHLGDEQKLYNISTMRRRRMAFHKIEAEIKKCEVVCANCHRERSNKRNPSTRYANIGEIR